MVDVRRLWPIAAVAVLLALMVLGSGEASAQGFDDLPPVLADVLARSSVIVDSLLGFFVSGNTLTVPQGEQLVSSLGQIVINFTHFAALLVTLF